ncbi:unnamed protein product [Clonostachys solani]|uniref:Protein kinase domain-containing protein n=1 Tax=Clonostachys solani TaxID=160281 RepID=A0A9P0ERT1_9HYPO|nr:unnamed protein product [Clonostachys solani]
MDTLLDEDEDIHNIVRTCAVLFDQILPVLFERPGNQYQLILNHQQHFQAWMDRADVLDQLSTGQAIELRLQTKPVILHLIRDLLNMIRDNLTRVLQLESPTQPPPTAGVGSWIRNTVKVFGFSISASRRGIDPNELSPASQACLHGVQGCIERLQDLLASIPDKTGILQDDHGDLEQNLEDGFLTNEENGSRKLVVRGKIKSRCPNITSSILRVVEASIEARRERLKDLTGEVDSDIIRPYICLMDGCDDLDSPFSRYDNWKQHMGVKHSSRWTQDLGNSTVWFCDINHDEDQIFKNTLELENHVKTIHDIPSLKVASMAEHNTLTLPGNINHCPLCGGSETDMEHHIADHLVNIASLSFENRHSAHDFELQSSTNASNVAESNNEQEWTQSPPVLDSSESESPLSLEKLRRLIRKGFVSSELDAKLFLPPGTRKQITESLRIRDLESLGPCREDPHNILQFVQRDAQVLFSILAFMGHEVIGCLEAMYRYDMTDKLLPIPIEMIDHCDEDDSDHECWHAPPLGVFHEEPWSLFTIETFYETQWKFLAPIFTPDRSDYHLQADSILPITHVKGVSHSNFSLVQEVEIHPDNLLHFEQGLGSSNRVALKKVQGLHDPELPYNPADEIKAQKMMNAMHHAHIQSAMAFVQRRNDHFILYPWADGGNLRAYWVQNDIWPLSEQLIKEVLEQLLGLCDGLWNMHKMNIRHGDLKPENILGFTKDGRLVGTLKLADMGLAKSHEEHTQERHHSTDTKWGTIRYEPPEIITAKNMPVSRRYDVWSMGCIILEFLVWIHYGPDGLRQFNKALAAKDGGSAAYYAIETRLGSTTAVLHECVENCISHLLEDAQGQDSALGDLIHLVKSKLLVIALSPNGSSESSIPCRADSMEVRQELISILSKYEDEPSYRLPSYVSKLDERPGLPSLLTTDYFGMERNAKDVVDNSGLFNPIEEYRFPENLSKGYFYPVDNEFAIKILKGMDGKIGDSQTKHVPQLCNICKSLKLDTPDFSANYSVAYLLSKTECELCQLFYNVTVSAGLANRRTVQFLRDGSTMKLMKGGPPVLSLVAHLEYDPYDVQHGFPMIERFPGPVSFEVMKQWLYCCDSSHQCLIPAEIKPKNIPALLLDVGGDLDSSTQICAAYNNTDGKYAALSYASEFDFNSDLSNNADGTELELEKMPATCQDAVRITRNLGIRYLWIERYCIRTRDGAHATPRWVFEMGDVFSNAYVVLVASSAKTADEGLLTPRTVRRAVTLALPEGGAISVCPFIDDFDKDVENSFLSSRAWAFQQKILARRSIFFTSTQIYWQCHRDTRAETLTKIDCPTSDINRERIFPWSYPGSRLKQIPLHQVYQPIYERYSRLKFKLETDRALAFQSLEFRISEILNVDGEVGLFFSPTGLCRSLLWRRDITEASLTRIDYQHFRRPPPSWSWTAYKGPIGYFDLPLGGIDWGDVQHLPTKRTLTAEAYHYDASQLSGIFYDCIENEQRKYQKCVVVGRTKNGEKMGNKPAYYLLIIGPKGPREDGDDAWERLGVAYSEHEGLLSNKEPEQVHIF